MRAMLTLSTALVLAAGPAFGHGGAPADLKEAPPDHQVEAVGYCKGTYEIRLKDGSTRRIREYDLRIKIDSSPMGPRRGTPALIPAGMAGDRAFLVFSGPAELKAAVEETC